MLPLGLGTAISAQAPPDILSPQPAKAKQGINEKPSKPAGHSSLGGLILYVIEKLYLSADTGFPLMKRFLGSKKY